MITSSDHNGRRIIVAKPNHSSTWRNNLMALGVIAIPSLGAAIKFTLMGAWPILPFAGAELLALGAALYYVNWKLQYRHVITFSDEQVRIDKGHYAPRRSWRFPRAEASLAVTPEAHPWEGPQMAVHSREEHVVVGEFLNREDAHKLLALLRGELRTGTHSREQEIKL
ncbi:MAG: DUF2244 domain-containing protein [Halieaceae bacterium]|nr:DUF2244 domain-containing protein [Halieaceae bacterium]